MDTSGSVKLFSRESRIRRVYTPSCVGISVVCVSLIVDSVGQPVVEFTCMEYVQKLQPLTKESVDKLVKYAQEIIGDEKLPAMINPDISFSERTIIIKDTGEV